MKNLFTLRKYFLRYKKKLGWGIVFIILSNIGAVYIPLLLKDAINSFDKNVKVEQLFHYGLLIVIAAVFAGTFRFFIRQTIIVVSREIEYDLREDFWSHIQGLSLRYFQNNSTGNVMAHATNDINAVRAFLGRRDVFNGYNNKADDGDRLDDIIEFFIDDVHTASFASSIVPGIQNRKEDP